MTKVLQLLVVAVGLTVAVGQIMPVLEYKQNVTVLNEVSDILKINLLSMEGNIPFLNDSRRHYAEIIHVIHYQGLQKCGGLSPDYYDSYQKHINSTAPEAIDKPEIVIDEVKYLLATVDSKTSELKELIAACIKDDDVCNKLIQDTVLENSEIYGPQVEVLFAAGAVASELKKQNNKFEEVSRKLAAHPYVITTPQDLKDIVEAVSKLLLILFRT